MSVWNRCKLKYSYDAGTGTPSLVDMSLPANCPGVDITPGHLFVIRSEQQFEIDFGAGYARQARQHDMGTPADPSDDIYVTYWVAGEASAAASQNLKVMVAGIPGSQYVLNKTLVVPTPAEWRTSLLDSAGLLGRVIVERPESPFMITVKPDIKDLLGIGLISALLTVVVMIFAARRGWFSMNQN